MTELLEDIMRKLRNVIKTAPTNNREILQKSSISLKRAREIQDAINTPPTAKMIGKK